jgi:hypothetical protein
LLNCIPGKPAGGQTVVQPATDVFLLLGRRRGGNLVVSATTPAFIETERNLRLKKGGNQAPSENQIESSCQAKRTMLLEKPS